MAATVDIAQYINSTPASQSIGSGSAHFGTSDELSPSTLPIPSSGSSYSYWIHTALVATAAPDNALSNLKWYSDGTNSFGTGVDAIVATASGYVQSDGVAGSSGSLLSSGNHGGLTGSPGGATSPLFLFSSGCKLAVAGSIGATTGSVGDEWVVQQMNVESTAGAGNTAEETITFEFDET